MRRVNKRHGPVLSDFDEPAGGSTVKRLSTTPDMALTKHMSNISPSQTNIGYHLVDHGYGATPQHQIMRDIPLAPPKTTEAVKRRLNLNMTGVVAVPARPKFKTPKQRSPRGSPAQGSRGGKKVERTRYDTSLGLLTKKFVQLLQTSPDGVVDLNIASVCLEVQKRRIYDITNVLEGIGILEKKSKNNIQWKCGKVGNPDISTLEKEMRTLEQKENLLDALIQSAECELRQLSENKRYAYITYGDLKSIPDFKDQTVIGIKAPPEAQLQVPNPTNGYEIYMKTETGEIEVFVCPENVQPNLPFPPVDPLLQDIKPLLTPVYEDMRQLVSPKIKNRPLTRHLGTAQRNLDESLNFTESSVKKEIKIEPEMQQPTVTLPVLTPSKPSSSTTRACRDLALNSVADANMTAEQKLQLSNALISEADDFGPMGGSLQLQIEDQQDEFNSEFLSLEPPYRDSEYTFSLGPIEGLMDLFDFDY